MITYKVARSLSGAWNKKGRLRIMSYTGSLALKAEPKILGLDSAFCLLGNRRY